MIRYALICEHQHTFEAWFANSDAFEHQQAADLVECPFCGTTKVVKQIMAPAVVTRSRAAVSADAAQEAKAEQCKPSAPAEATPAQTEPPAMAAAPAEMAEAFAAMAEKLRTHVERNYTYVGSDFAQQARAMHYGEIDEAPVWGETTPEQARALAEDGIPALPLPPAAVPRRADKLN